MSQDTLKWGGQLPDLQVAIARIGFTGHWVEQDDKWRFNGDAGEVIIWYPKTKTVQVQGLNHPRVRQRVQAELVGERRTLDFGDE